MGVFRKGIGLSMYCESFNRTALQALGVDVDDEPVVLKTVFTRQFGNCMQIQTPANMSFTKQGLTEALQIYLMLDPEQVFVNSEKLD